MSNPGENLNLVLGVLAAIGHTGRTKELATILEEGVVWQGLLPELVCTDRNQVLGVLGRAPFPRITRVEAEEVGDRVAISVQSADFAEGPAGSELEPASGTRSLVFSFRDGKVVRIESFPSREAAFALVEA